VGKQAAHDALEAAVPAGNPLVQMAAEEQDRVLATYLDSVGDGERIAPIRRDLQATMERGAGVFRTESSLKESIEDVAKLKDRYQAVTLDDHDRAFNTELITALELGNMLEVAETVLWSGAERRESRGSHTRRDHPDRDDERFLKHSLASATPDGPPRIDYRDVTITRWPVAERKY
jgi:succinate dehydrogenase/fumarate reductase flavoprotein subunit